MLIGMANCPKASSGIRFEGVNQGLSPVHDFHFSTTESIPKIKSEVPKKTVAAVPLTMSHRKRHKIWRKLADHEFDFPILIHLSLASAVGIRLLNQTLFPDISEQKVAMLVNYGTCLEVSLVEYRNYSVELLGQLFDRELIAEDGNISLIGFFNLLDKVLAKSGIENIDFIFVEEKVENPELRLFLEANLVKEKISVFKSSVLAVGAAIICCKLLKAVDDTWPWGDTKVLLSPLTYFLILKVLCCSL